MAPDQISTNSLGAHLRAARLERGLTQGQLSIRLGISRQAISKWEHDRSQPDLENLMNIAALYGMSVDELLGKPPADKAIAAAEATRNITPSEGARIARDRRRVGAYTVLSGFLIGIGLSLCTIVGTQRAAAGDAPYLAFALSVAALLICLKLFEYTLEYRRRGGSRVLFALQLATVALVSVVPLALGGTPAAMGACALAAVACSICASRIVAWRLLYQRTWNVREDFRDPLGRRWHGTGTHTTREP